MSGQSSVGSSHLYEAGDQRNVPQAELHERDRYKEGEKHSHKNLDSTNKLASQGQKPDPSHHHNKDYDPEAAISQKDSTKPAKLHGNEPSKGAKIDQELQEEDEQRLREKGIKK
ncbi:hypothetical protein ATERTT37_004443 [Aspergillus terreus]